MPRHVSKKAAWCEDETQYLGQLREVLETGKCPARTKLEAYHGRWGGNVDPAYTEEAY